MSVLTRDGGITTGSPQSRSGLAPGVRLLPDRLVLGVRHGETPSTKPPVRIYLGTEPAHYRATRVFV